MGSNISSLSERGIGSSSLFLPTVLLGEKGEMHSLKHPCVVGLNAVEELGERGSCKMGRKYEGAKQ